MSEFLNTTGFVPAERFGVICCNRVVQVRKDQPYNCDVCGVKYEGEREEESLRTAECIPTRTEKTNHDRSR